jgi:hypothetical protein
MTTTPFDQLLDQLVVAARRREHAEHFGRHGDGKPEAADATIAAIKSEIRAQFKQDSERLEATEAMLRELAGLHTDEGYLTWTVDEIVADKEGRILTIYGTTDQWHALKESGKPFKNDDYYRRGKPHPYIIGEV